MHKAFSFGNLEETLTKKPAILYYSQDGACGPSGLFLVIFDDGSCYSYSTLYPQSDLKLIHAIIEHVPEFKPLLQIKGEYAKKRESFISSLELINLGMGNEAFMRSDVFESLSVDDHVYFPDFVKFVKARTGVGLDDIFFSTKKDIIGE